MAPFVVGVRFGLKSHGFAWECPQKVKKTSSDILVDFILTVDLQYLVHMAPNRGLLRFRHFPSLISSWASRIGAYLGFLGSLFGSLWGYRGLTWGYLGDSLAFLGLS